MRRFLVALLVAALGLFALPAQAHVQLVGDPDDTRGRLDIKRARLNHDATSVILMLHTYERWRKRSLRFLANGKTMGRISFIFKNGPESFVRVDVNRRDDNKLWATIVFCNPAGCDYDRASMRRAYRPDRRGVRVRVPRDLLPSGPTLRWYSETAFGKGCNGNCYFDSAPNSPRLARHEVAP